jgi:hypothetical protein
MPDRGFFTALAEAEARDSSDPDDNLQSCAPRNCRSLGFPGFPVELRGVGALYAAFLNESSTRRNVQCCVAGNPGSLGMTRRGERFVRSGCRACLYSGVRCKSSHGVPAKCAKKHASCANRERRLAFLPSCASLYCEPDDAPAVARCFAGAFGREPKGEPR